MSKQMRIETLTQAKDKKVFIDEFCDLSNEIIKEQDRPATPASYNKYLISLFSYLDQELIILRSPENKVMARVAVAKKTDEPKKAFFGLFEFLIEYKNHINLIYEAIDNWSKEQDIKSLYGPVDFNTWLGNRFKSKGFDKDFSWEPNSPKEYIESALNNGYEIDKEYISCFYDDLLVSYDRTEPAFKMAGSEGYKFRGIDLHKDGEIDLLYKINISGFSDNYQYSPISREEYERTHIQFIRTSDMQYSYFLLDQNEKELGYIYSFVDGDSLIIKSIVMLPDHRGAKLSSALVHISLKKAYENKILKAAGACVRKGNVSEHFFDHLGKTSRRNEYALVSKNLN